MTPEIWAKVLEKTQEHDVTAPPDDLVARLHRAIADYAKATFDQDEGAFRDVGYIHGHLFADALAITAENKALRKLVAVIERAHPALVGKARYDLAAGAANER